jgi:hypothetical protein
MELAADYLESTNTDVFLTGKANFHKTFVKLQKKTGGGSTNGCRGNQCRRDDGAFLVIEGMDN